MNIKVNGYKMDKLIAERKLLENEYRSLEKIQKALEYRKMNLAWRIRNDELKKVIRPQLSDDEWSDFVLEHPESNSPIKKRKL